MGFAKTLGRWTLPFGYFFERGEKIEAARALMKSVAPATAPVPLVRFGGEFDGGYLVPDDLDGITACFSPGVKDSADFELDIAALGIPCFLADHSVEKCPVEHPLFQFEKRFIGATEDDTFMTLDAWVRAKAGAEGDLLLQMDIEGFEYETILSVDEDILKRFRMMVVEFHTMDGVFSKRSHPIIAATFKKILKHFHAVHIHPNNCLPSVRYRGLSAPPVMEFTFLRKDRFSRFERNTEFPHPLDAANRPERPVVALPECWYT